MKKIVVFLLLTAFSSGLYSQNNCTTPLPNQQFQQKFEQIRNKPNDKIRLITAKQIVRSYCFSSSQIKKLASLFENDFERFEFAKASYENTTDKDNFYDVYDAFIYYSVVFRLHDFVLTKRNDLSTRNGDTKVNNENNIVFPNYNYPNYKTYRGERKCNEIVTKEIFNFIISKVNSYEDDYQKYMNAVSQIRNKCIPTEYLMKIGSLISSEKYKLDFSKEAINSVYDIDQFIEMRQIFNSPKGRSDFMNILSGNTATNSNDCQINQQEYNKIISSINNEQYNSTKVNSAKHIIQTKSCFTALQIKGIIELFSYENSKLEIAILAFDFVTDPSDYYMVVSKSLSFESSRRKLLDHINKKKGKN